MVLLAVQPLRVWEKERTGRKTTVQITFSTTAGSSFDAKALSKFYDHCRC